MPDVRVMTPAERSERVEDYIELLEGFALPLVGREPGPRAATELQAA
ncbi:MAG TPA: hypothetical protein HA326_08940 [Thermoplasmata archaeon]|nr:hypothetical protein [Thermoplasmata archaeon]